MAVTITWKVHRCKRDSATGGITGVSAVCTASDTRIVDGEEIAQKKQKWVQYDDLTPDPSASDFILFDNLTEENILGWVHSLLGDDKKVEIETTLTNKVNQKFAPVALLGNPWD